MRVYFTFLGILTLAACMGPDREPSIGEAFVGPATLNLRQELAPKSPVSALVKHGDRLDVLATRRRFLKVRTADNKEGWVDGYALLTTQQMEDLRTLAERAQQLPSQGMASVYDVLNMHTEPSRQSPSFYQIPEKGQVDVIGHRVAPRGQIATVPPVALSVKAEQPVRRRRREARAAKAVGPPPMPAGPKVPANWLALSAGRDEREAEIPTPAIPVKNAILKPKPDLTEAEKANVLEDWSLVRTHDGRVGWALARYLVLSIPDEVAQYAEGHRITTYFSLGEVRDRDRDVVRHNWLWTTIKKRAESYQFDQVRVFTWSTRRHRYETAYRETGIRGYYPVQAKASPSAEFSLIVEEGPGQYFKKTYAFNGYQVRVVSKEAAQLRDDGDLRAAPLSVAFAQSFNQPEKSWYEKTKASVVRGWQQWFK